jgi:5'-nucleotidase
MTSAPLRRALAAGLGTAALTATLIAGASPAGAAPKPKPTPPGPPPVDLQLLAINDFHGQLEPPSGSSSTLPGFPDPDGSGPATAQPFGGIEYLATQVRALEAETKKQNTLTVAAGDLIGASPLLSAAFHDEPTIEAMNLLGLDYAAVGNHEFDEGVDELLRMQNGGCLAEESCPSGQFGGADFQYLAANTTFEGTDETILPPYAVHKVQGIKVGFIGMTLEGTPSVVTPSGVAGLDFADEAETANRYAAELEAQGVEAIVVLLHEGGAQTPAPDVDSCNNLQGPVTEIVPAMDDAIDVVISGHTHQPYTCTIDGRLVTSGSSVGRVVTDIDLTLDRRTGDVLTAVADNVPVSRDVPQDPAQSDLIARYNEFVAPIANRQVGTAATPLPREPRDVLFGTVLGESPMGNLIADAMLAATDEDADIALMNPGGVRASIDQGPITYGEAFSVQPFGNFLTTITLTDEQLLCVLEQQFAVGGSSRNVLQPAGITYSVDPNGTSSTVEAPCSGTRVPDDSVFVGTGNLLTDGIDSYRVTVNNFLADGGDGFTLLTEGTDRVDVASPEDDLAALVEYFGANPDISAPATGRITVLP